MKSMSENLYGMNGIFNKFKGWGWKNFIKNIDIAYTIQRDPNLGSLKTKKEIFEKGRNFYELCKRAKDYYEKFTCDVHNYSGIWKSIQELNEEQKVLLSKQNDLRFLKDKKSRYERKLNSAGKDELRRNIDEMKLEVSELKKVFQKAKTMKKLYQKKKRCCFKKIIGYFKEFELELRTLLSVFNAWNKRC